MPAEGNPSCWAALAGCCRPALLLLVLLLLLGLLLLLVLLLLLLLLVVLEGSSKQRLIPRQLNKSLQQVLACRPCNEGSSSRAAGALQYSRQAPGLYCRQQRDQRRETGLYCRQQLSASPGCNSRLLLLLVLLLRRSCIDRCCLWLQWRRPAQASSLLRTLLL